MFNNVVLDVFIGLIFIFLLYSLLATILQEIIARLLNLRAKLLVKAIRVMLNDRDQESDDNINPILKTLSRYFKSTVLAVYRLFNPLDENNFTKVFYKHPSVKYLGQSSWQSKPSFLEPSNFSATIVSLLRGREYDGREQQMNAIYRTLFEPDQHSVAVETARKTFAASIQAETLQYLQQLYIDAQKDIDRFKILLENWFNETMSRASGWYRRQTQTILFILGLFIAISFNVDTIAIYKLLAKDKTARENLVQLAIISKPKYDSITSQLTPITKKDSAVDRAVNTVLKNSAGQDSVTRHDTIWKYTETRIINISDSALSETYRIVQSDIDKAENIAGLGWPDKDSCKRCKELQDCLDKSCVKDSASIAIVKDSINFYNKKFHCGGNPYQTSGGIRFLGWLLTALAVSLGSPFWFELFTKITQMRGSGSKAKADDNVVKNNSAGSGSSPVQRVG